MSSNTQKKSSLLLRISSPPTSEGQCWGGKKCKPDEFGHCIVCCDCKECYKALVAAADNDSE